MDAATLADIRFREGIDLIAITGGPCGGKDTLMAKARQRLEGYGLHVRVIREIATDLIRGGFDPDPARWPEDPMAFQRHVLLDQLDAEMRFIQMVKDQRLSGRVVILANRGAIDGFGYASDAEYRGMLAAMGLSRNDLLLRYKGAVHMVTAADGAEESYTTANNEARRETPQEARERDQRTQRAWWGHPHLHVIDNHAPGGFDGKCRRALVAIARMLNMPEPLEKEHWFVLRAFKRNQIPREAVQTAILQTYLFDRAGVIRRIRKSTHEGVDSYFYTEKEETGNVGERIEREREITRGEYERLQRERNPALRVISKIRHSFTSGNRHFELDEFLEPVRGFYKLEIEVSDLKEPVDVPISWNAKRVTGDTRYSNYSIAAGLLPAHEHA